MDSPWVDNSSTSTYYCWADDPREASTHEDVFSMTVTWDMFNYFSQPGRQIDPKSFVAIYCLNPLGNDDCPVGLCPNSDIAGLLVRIAYYVTAFCLTILIFHAPKRVEDVFYYQISTVYSLLITCSVSLIQQNITRFHATIALFIASSPVSIYFLVYSVRAFWGEHRLDEVLGKKNYLNRGLVFFAAGIWISIVIYISLGSTKGHFTQESCSTITARRVFEIGGVIGAPSVIIAVIAALSWFVSIMLVRKEIWPPGERYRPKFVTVWKTIGRRFPLVFFITIGIIPMSMWIWTTEETMTFSEFDSIPSLTFGQILALFIAVPPFLQVCQLGPQIWAWFIELPWIACCWKRKRRGKRSVPAREPDLSSETYHMDLPMLPEDRNREFYEGEEEMQESAMCLEPNRHHGP